MTTTASAAIASKRVVRLPHEEPQIWSGDAPTLTKQQHESLDRVRLCLVVVGEGTFATMPLPSRGPVTIGRSDKNDIRIDDRSVSREHAILHVGERLYIEDLGSANGTQVDKQRIAPREPVEVRPDHVVDIGSSMVIVQRNAAVRPRRLWTHDYFEARIEDECTRCEHSGSSFAVVRLHVDDAQTNAAHVQDALAEVVGSLDVVAAYGPGEYEMLLTDVAPAKANEMTGRIVERLDAQSVSLRLGIACYPRDGRTQEALVAKACESVRSEPVDDVLEKPIIVEAPAMKELYRVVDRIAAGTISVLLLGETGVGKEILAETVHRQSPRRNAPFVRLNCAAFSEPLLESELFGHEKGAFTGADATKPGLLETANGGTVFLDEVGELPIALQVKLLRVIDERKVLRVGGLGPRAIDVRFVSATNRDLEREVLAGSFRPDLFFRLNGISLVIPPLRQRTSEIEPLARAFVAHISRALSARPPTLSDEALRLLETYSWPGNIRELKNFLERAILLAGDVIRPEHLPVEKMRATLLSAPHEAPVTPPATPAMPMPTPTYEAGSPTSESPAATYPPPDADLYLDDPFSNLSAAEQAERQRIVEALEQCGGNQTQAAKLLGVSRRTLVSRLDKYDIPRPRKSR